MNKFYQQHIFIQWLIAMVMLLIALLIFYYWIISMQLHLISLLLIFFIIPLGQFLMSPINKLLGIYKYLSPMLLVYAPTKKKYDLHNGTSFDYLFTYQGNKYGLSWQNKLLGLYIDGLLQIINEIEQEELPKSIEVRGSSYFFSNRTIKSLGFELKPTGLLEKLNIIINYLDLIWMYSLAKGKVSFPKLNNIKTVSTTGDKLITKKEKLMRIKTYLNKRKLLLSA